MGLKPEYGLLWALDIAIAALRGDRRYNGGPISLKAAERLKRERDMRHQINQRYGNKRRSRESAASIRVGS